MPSYHRKSRKTILLPRSRRKIDPIEVSISPEAIISNLWFFGFVGTLIAIVSLLLLEPSWSLAVYMVATFAPIVIATILVLAVNTLKPAMRHTRTAANRTREEIRRDMERRIRRTEYYGGW